MRKVVFFSFFMLCTSHPLEDNTVKSTLRSQTSKERIMFEIDVVNKTYSYRAKTNNSSKYESAHFEKDPITGEESLVVEGGYGFIADDGRLYITTYTADKNGYHPSWKIVTLNNKGGSKIPPRIPGRPPVGSPPRGIDSVLLCSLVGSGCK